MSDAQWVQGDSLGILVPACGEALRTGGVEYLTEAFRASGAMALDNQVTRITKFEECPGGSTGRKLFLSVEYAQPVTELPTQLFVKFSRDFDDVIRDRAKNQLDAEVRLALLSRTSGFPVAVPKCLFADYNQASGTGVLITERIAFGKGAIELLYEKCMDAEMPDSLGHYKALLKAVAGLAGTHKAGRLADNVSTLFPFDATAASANDRIRYTEQQLLNRVARYSEFAANYPQLFPANITTPIFIEQLKKDIPRFLEHELAIKRFLYGKPEFIALCHWNANVDNAWFWRDGQGELQCGLIDWGRVGQMSVAHALFGALSAAEIALWDTHLEALLAHFAAEFHRCGGPALNVEELKTHLLLFVALMGLAWLMDAPALIQKQIPDLASIKDRFDPKFKSNETARVQLQMMTNVLNLWQTRDFGQLLNRLIK
ncbi:MAG: hypothetical protein V4607_03330 [Pseudomonadota bacterium]